MGHLQQPFQDTAQKVTKMDQDNKEHFKSMYDRISDISADANAVQRDMGTGGERLVDMRLKSEPETENQMHQVVVAAHNESLRPIDKRLQY